MKMRLIPALLGAAFSGAAGASGFQLLEQTASGIGNAYAGSAAVAENASTVFYNPAGMTQLQAHEFSGGATYIQPSYKFSNDASSTGVLTGDDVDGGAAGTVPNIYLSSVVGDNLYAGLGIGAPFGLSTEYDPGWMGGAQSLKFDIVTLNINPSIAYKLNETVSLGFGLNLQQLDAEYVRQYAVTSAPAAATTASIKLKDDSVGWNAGVLVNVSPETKVGVSYRSAMAYTATGDLNVAGAVNVAAKAKADIKLPDTLILSATHKLNDTCELLADASWTGWSSIPEVKILNTTSGTVAQTLDTDFRDTWRVAVGLNHRMSDTMKLKTGIAYDQTPVKAAATRLVSLPDNDRVWLSVGAQWKLTPASTLDAGATYLLVQEARIHNDQSLSGRGLVDGTYQDSAWILGAQYSLAF